MNKISKFFKYFAPLIEEEPGKISLGRTSFWILFVFFLRNYATFRDIPNNIVILISTLLGYGFGKKYIFNKYQQNNGVSDFLNDLKDKIKSSSPQKPADESDEESED